MRIELEYNARSIPPADIARSFVPPTPHFGRLLARNHTLLLGPRGSGKTTLLKMLTARALNNWNHPEAHTLAPQVTFNAAFVPADIAWGRQIEGVGSFDFKSTRKEAAFVLHTLRALVHAMREATELAREGNLKPHAKHLAVELDYSQEEKFVRLITPHLGISPALPSLLGVELALEARLDAINAGDKGDSFTVENFPSKMSLLISAFNGLTKNDSRRWALLFDEMEIAPISIKSFLLAGIRSFDERIIVKLALAPYMDDAGFDRDPTSPQPLHDYHTIQLTYPNKDDAISFGAELFTTTFQRIGVDSSALNVLFEPPVGGTQFGRRTNQKRRGIPDEFKSLAKKDESFAKFVSDRNLFSPNYRFNENNIAQDIRKVFPIVVARNYYLRRFEGDRVVASRSRKSHSLYAGYPAIVEITEGNPRAILTCVGPMAQEYQADLARAEGYTPVSRSIQTKAIRRVELLLTSLLQVVPLDLGGFEAGKGLLGFVDTIGRAFEDRLLRRSFTADYVSTFLIDENVSGAVVNAVGKALNAGALIHVPHADGGPDALLRGLRGQRFRLSYALAARYRLLLTLGDRINLSTLLLEMRGVDVSNAQQTLL
ncbi:MAG: hypothetical protein WBA62_17225 [Xanthobacteraceae bacterium]